MLSKTWLPVLSSLLPLLASAQNLTATAFPLNTVEIPVTADPVLYFTFQNDTNTTQEAATRRVSYFVYDGQAIIDGDVRFGTEEEIIQAAVDPLTKRSATTGHSRRALSQSTPNRWPGGRIEYRYESELTRASRHVNFEAAIKRWADTLPFLQFIEISPPADVPWSPSGPRTIRAIEGTVSWSDIGGSGGEIRLGDHGLDSIGVYTHEIGHTLGLYHEHKRPDRDDYVEVVCGNMWQPSDCATGSGWAAQFSKEQPEWVNWAGQYDVNSVMHYDPWAFSNGLGPVLKSKTATELCSRCRESPTKTDAQRVCEIYWEDCHSVCGDGILSSGYEECDDGNNLNGDSCSSDCKKGPGSLCGNGVVDPGEECDHGPSGSWTCDVTCKEIAYPYCGDGKVNQISEECDDGPNGSATCTPLCKTITTPPPTNGTCFDFCDPLPPVPDRNMCDITTSCTTIDWPGARSYGEHYCACRAGYRANGVDVADTKQQYRMPWPGQVRVFVKPGLVCDTPCTEHWCAEVPEKAECF
ncbi:hypothetical protein H2201_007621 [Coniosporium apollinis]|uniref:Metalloendopeptidase n=2 Tax=Coniosporium TaxID=2810619 RepID=A0ABQ9NNU5_9PEZI|nr:hypothetical protein H2199_006326 [Cladosporium sp. JES 115]KAJ9658840.1 hypothetical protein H2201_007621 [Coniosporium apollinis]